MGCTILFFEDGPWACSKNTGLILDACICLDLNILKTFIKDDNKSAVEGPFIVMLYLFELHAVYHFANSTNLDNYFVSIV